MARRVGWIKHHALELETPIKLDRDTLTFEAEWNGVRYTDTDGAALRTKILEVMEEAQVQERRSVISVTIDTETGATVRTSRFHVADAPQSVGLVTYKWEQPGVASGRRWRDADRFDNLPSVSAGWGSRTTYRVPYSEETWELVKRARKQLSERGEQLGTALCCTTEEARQEALQQWLSETS